MAETSSSLSGWLDRAMQRDVPTVLKLNGMGSISVYPRQQCYISDVADWGEVFASPGIQFSEAPAMHHPSLDNAHPLSELQWRAAYHVVLANGSPESVTWDLFQLVSWPNLSRLPEELVEPVTRICALLWRKPTVGFLVSRVLAMPAHQALAVLTVLRDQGHVVSPRSSQRAPAGAAPRQGAQPDSSMFQDTPADYDLDGVATDSKPAKQSLVGKLWRRLVGH